MLVVTKLLSQKKLCLLWQTHGVTTTICLPWQNFCRKKKMFVATNVQKKRLLTCLVQQNWSQQKNYVCCDKRVWCNKTGRNKYLSQEHFFLLRQTYFCCDKTCFVVTKVCLSWQKYFVMTKVLLHITTKPLSRQKWHFWQLPPMIFSSPSCGPLNSPPPLHPHTPHSIPPPPPPPPPPQGSIDQTCDPGNTAITP